MATSRLASEKLTCPLLSLILLKISSYNFQNPLMRRNLKRSRPALKALILGEFPTHSGSWFQYLITLLLKKSCADLNG